MLFQKGHVMSEEIKRKIGETCKRKQLYLVLQTPESRARAAETKRGRHRTLEDKIKISNGLMGFKRPPRTEEYRTKLGLAHKGKPLTEEHRNKVSMGLKGKKHTASHITNQVISRIKTLQIKPNKAEISLNDILNVTFPNEWKFVGDGQLILGGYCPDFMNSNGKKALIELFGDYWHKGQNPEDRAGIFEPYGYSTLVIWEHELKNPESVIDKVRNTFYA